MKSLDSIRMAIDSGVVNSIDIKAVKALVSCYDQMDRDRATIRQLLGRHWERRSPENQRAILESVSGEIL